MNAAQKVLAAEQAELNAQVELMDLAAEAGEAVCEVKYYAATDRLNALRRLIHEAGMIKRSICKNTAALVSANID